MHWCFISCHQMCKHNMNLWMHFLLLIFYFFFCCCCRYCFPNKFIYFMCIIYASHTVFPYNNNKKTVTHFFGSRCLLDWLDCIFSVSLSLLFVEHFSVFSLLYFSRMLSLCFSPSLRPEHHPKTTTTTTINNIFRNVSQSVCFCFFFDEVKNNSSPWDFLR